MNPATLAVEHRSYDPEPLEHRHDYRQVVFPDRGRLELTVDGRIGFVGGAQLAVVEVDTPHTCWATTPTNCLIVNLRADRGCSPKKRNEPAPFRQLDDRLSTVAQAMRIELASGGLDDPLIAESLGLYLSASLATVSSKPVSPSSPTPAQRRLAAQAREYVDAHFQDDFSIADVATAVCASPAHLQRCFQAGTGTSLVRYVHQVRLHRAADLLRASDLSVTKVALDVGFADPNYFARLFRREFGVPPARFRVAV
jgi:AraC-like DNA-binding protein